MNGSGDWIDRVSKVILQLGLPTVFAVVLLWFVLSRFSASLDQVVHEMQAQTNKLSEIQLQIIARDKRVFNYEHRESSEGAR